MYNILKPLFFLIPPEIAHNLGLYFVWFLGLLHKIGLYKRPTWAQDPSLQKETPFGKIDSPLGLAAGFDKNAVGLWGWQALGFAFVEVGTMTPRAQPGNEKPRLFRFTRFQALVNRLGFNNDGVKIIAERLRKARASGLKIKVGGNIGKNIFTPIEKAAEDYRKCAMMIYPHVDYLVINVSSPNTPGLREMQSEVFLENIVKSVRTEAKTIPLFIKVAPDQWEKYIDGILNVVEKYQLQGVICGNTLSNHASSKDLNEYDIIKLPLGGLSGGPCFFTNLTLAESYHKDPRSPFVIGVGGITTTERAQEYLNRGASLIQIYTGFIYNGPSFIKRILKKIKEGKAP